MTDTRPSYYSRIMAPPQQADNESAGGTPWVSRIGTILNPRSFPGHTGLDAGRRKYRGNGGPFDPPPAVSIVSQSVQLLNPSNMNDKLLRKQRAPWLHTGDFMPPVNIGAWNASGPERPSLRILMMNFRRAAGWSGQANEGMHTNPGVPSRTLPGKQAMVPRSQNRLTVARYNGQSYSATTQTLGAGRR